MKYYSHSTSHHNWGHTTTSIENYARLTRNITRVPVSQIRFWSKSWDELNSDEKCTYLAFRRVAYLNNSNIKIVRAAYLQDSHIFRLVRTNTTYTPSARTLGFDLKRIKTA